MIKNYLLITFRNFARNKNYTLINILGLSIGLTSCLIIFLLIRFDVNFDKFHQNYDRIYRVVRDVKSAAGVEHDAVTPYPFGPAFRQDFPDIPKATQFHHHQEVFAVVGSEKHKIEHVIFADSLFFKVFDFGVVSGNPSRELGQPNKAFLTESLAQKLNVWPGDRMKVDNVLDLEVVGLLKDTPPNSHIHYNMMVSMPSFTKEFFSWGVDHWGLNSAGFSYVVMPENMQPQQLVERFPKFVQKYHNKEDAENNTYLLQPLTDIHFNTEYGATPGPDNVNATNLYVLGVLGFFILIIASINFVNLATALAVKKSKEIGIRKTLGAQRPQLTLYFMCETLVLTLIAVVISLGLVEWMLPWLNSFTEKQIDLPIFSDPVLLTFLGTLVLVTTILAGFYPGIILSGFEPVSVLKNKMSGQQTSGSFVRRALVIFQFVIAQMMIIGTLIVTDQMNYFNSKPLGFSADAIVTVPLPKNDVNILNNLRTRLESNSNIKNVSFAVGAPTSETNIGTGYYLEEKGVSDNRPVGIKTVDRHYKDTYGLELLAGRWISESDEMKAADTTLKDSDGRYSLVVNEAAIRKLGFNSAEEALEKRIHIGVNDITAPIVGVMKDFHTTSLHNSIDAVVMFPMPGLYYNAGIKISTADMQSTIEYIRKHWSELYPEYYFEHDFLDEHIAGLYRSEQRQLVLFRIFSGISIFIGCLGLLGLVSFMANQKLKEIGVRKVFGASIASIITIFSKEFVLLVLLAFVFAAPLSWMLMNQWLQNFQYHIDIHWSVYLIGLFVTLMIALITVSYRSIRAGLTNPIDSLRTE